MLEKNSEESLSSKQVVHSDFIIHWTGKDINDIIDWNPMKSSKTFPEEATQLYLKRLKDILKYGLWMTKDNEVEKLHVKDKLFKKPLVARTCFTELRLSESIKHAQKFGCLGIGVKRFFLFNRLGSPMVYIQRGQGNLFLSPFFDLFKEKPPESELLSFFKHMSSGQAKTYDLFAESEWRIIFSHSIKNKLLDSSWSDIVSLFWDPKDEPKDEEDKRIHEYYESLKDDKKPEYLIPLDAWFSMIIYPSPQAKIAAYEDKEVSSLIQKIKERGPNGPGLKVMPIEVDLDACANF